MKSNNWKDCLTNFESIKITPDFLKSNSLIETSKNRIKFIKEIEIKESNANFIFENYYTSILEILHAIALNNGYKVDNHICLGFYLKEILKEEKLYLIFDRCRFRRNSLVYYGKIMNFETAKTAIIESENLFKNLSRTLA